MAKKSATGLRVSPEQLEVVAKEEDAPLPSADELAKLHSFRPDLVDVSVSEAREEIAHRRARDTKVTEYVFIERILGLVIAFILPCIAFWVSYRLAMAGHETTASVISGGTLVSIVVAILKRK